MEVIRYASKKYTINFEAYKYIIWSGDLEDVEEVGKFIEPNYIVNGSKHLGKDIYTLLIESDYEKVSIQPCHYILKSLDTSEIIFLSPTSFAEFYNDLGC